MGAGKIFCIIGGIITLLATFLFSLATTVLFPGYYMHGIGLFIKLVEIFTIGTIVEMVMAIVFIIFLLAGVFIIIGVKSRAVAIIGAILAMVLGLYFILTYYSIIPYEIGQFTSLFASPPLVTGIIPFHFALGGSFAGEIGLGSYFLLGGGVLGLIGGIMGPDGF